MAETILTALSYIGLTGAFAGWATFRVLYRPWRSSGHSMVGRHLIRTADSLLALFGVSLLNAVIPFPPLVGQVVTALVLAWLCGVAWERVYLLKQERRAREEAGLEDTDPTRKL